MLVQLDNSKLNFFQNYVSKYAHWLQTLIISTLYFWFYKSWHYLGKGLNDMGFPGGSEVKASSWNVGDQIRSLCWEDPLEKETATHSSTLAWKNPWREEPGRLQSISVYIFWKYLHFIWFYLKPSTFENNTYWRPRLVKYTSFNIICLWSMLATNFAHK